LLFATLAYIKQLAYPQWSEPVLQMAFVAAYIILSPFVGQFADSFAKGRVMFWANSIKLLGGLLICVGFNPFVGYGMVGVGAAAYSPAKYGILGELTRGDLLVKANGMMESSTIAAILLGSMAGGMLSDWNVMLALAVCVLAYGLAVLANLLIPKLSAARVADSWHPGSLSRQFFFACRSLWQLGQCRYSLLGTSLFWGSGVTLRFLLVLWVPAALGLTDNATPTLLNAMVAVGIVFGAAAAAKFIRLDNVLRCLPAGILMGITVIALVLQQHLLPAYGLLFVIGVCGGFFVVPLNALVQHLGRDKVGVGPVIAVQNLLENSAMLLMLALYSLLVMFKLPAVVIGSLFGLFFALTMTGLWLGLRGSQR